MILKLIEAIKSKSGSFNFFRLCRKNPEDYFKKKNLLDEYNSLTPEEKLSFSSDQLFFDLLAKYGYKKESKDYQCSNKCQVCGEPAKFSDLCNGYYKTCGKKECIEYGKANTIIEKDVKQMDVIANEELKIRTLIEVCQKKDGVFSLFIKKCIKDQELFFKNKGLIKNYNSLDQDLKDCFKDERKFFDLLVKYGYKKDKKYNLYSKCLNCGAETEYISMVYGYQNFCCESCRSEHRSGKIKEYCDSRDEEKIKSQVDKAAKTRLKKHGYEYFDLKKFTEQLSKDNGKVSWSQKHIKNFDKIKNFDFINENFVENKEIDKYAIMGFFNVSGAYYDKNILPVLREKGFYTKTCKSISEGEKKFIRDLEAFLGKRLLTQHVIFSGLYRFFADGYDPETNTVYEFLGDYWHGNPEVHSRDMLNDSKKKTYGELYDETFERFDVIKSMGYNIVYIWEYQYYLEGLSALTAY